MSPSPTSRKVDDNAFEMSRRRGRSYFLKASASGFVIKPHHKDLYFLVEFLYGSAIPQPSLP